MAPQNVNLYHLPIIASLLLPDCDMPLFTFISGYLFEYLYEEKHRYRNFGLFLQNKLNRLLIPFFILSVLVIATSYQEAFSNILWGEGCHLWYCAMLFWCFMMAWIIKKLDARWILFLLLLVSLTLVFLYPNFWYIPFRLPLGIDNSLYYFSYFLMGGCGVALSICSVTHLWKIPISVCARIFANICRWLTQYTYCFSCSELCESVLLGIPVMAFLLCHVG